MAKKEVTLGCIAKDLATGFKGTLIHKVEQLNGNIQWAVQPLCGKNSSEMPNAILIDHHMLEYVEVGVSDKVTPVPNPTDIALGNKVKDILSGFEGFVTQKATYMNGCEALLVQPTITDKTGMDKGVPDQHYVEAIRLKKIDDGIAKKITLPEPSPETGKRPGGPMRRLAQNVVRR